MSTLENDDFMENRAHKKKPGDSDTFSAPLGMLKSARLVFASGVQGLELMDDLSMPDLYQARFKHYVPRVSVENNIVTIDYRHHPFTGQLVNLRRPLAEISLNSSIPWEIEFRTRVSHLNADLSGLQLRSLDIMAGANQIRLRLSRPSGTGFIYVSGGISQAAIRMPSMSEVRVQIGGGYSNLAFDDRRLGAVGGETSLQSPDFESTVDRYDICIAGGASNLVIERKG